jgi:DNA-binding beta-propeller fold protein YncE
VEAEIPVGERPYGVAVGAEGCFVGVTNLDSHDVTVVDARSLQPLTTLKDPEAQGPFGIAIAGSRAYVTNSQSHTVSVFELGTCP